MVRKEWLSMLSFGLQGDREAGNANTLIEISADNRVLIENHCGVCAFGTEKILIRTHYGCVSVHGCKLELHEISGCHVVITGKIQSVQLSDSQR